MTRILTKSEAETGKAGYIFADNLKPFDVVCLNGELGAGKTIFIKGMVKRINGEINVTSPTFTIVNEYEGVIPVFHFDVYRIDDPIQMYDIGFEEYLYEREGIVLIEWAEKISGLIPDNCIMVDIEKTGEKERMIHIYDKENKRRFLIEDFSD